MKNYVYFNKINYEIVDKQVFSLPDITGVTLDSSFVKAESVFNLRKLLEMYDGKVNIPECAWCKELNNPSSGGYIPIYEEEKRSTIAQFEFIQENCTAECVAWQDLLTGSPVDISATLVTVDGMRCGFTRDYHVCANILFMGGSYVYGITHDELSRSHGLANFKNRHIERVNRLLSNLKIKNNN